MSSKCVFKTIGINLSDLSIKSQAFHS